MRTSLLKPIYRLRRWHMHTHRPRYNYAYTAHILTYTYTCTHIAHALIQAIHTFGKTHTREHTHTHAHTHTHTQTHMHNNAHTLCQSFIINGLNRHTSTSLYMRIKRLFSRSSNKGLNNMGWLKLCRST